MQTSAETEGTESYWTAVDSLFNLNIWLRQSVDTTKLKIQQEAISLDCATHCNVTQCRVRIFRKKTSSSEMPLNL
jgi:hypothetical protein